MWSSVGWECRNLTSRAAYELRSIRQTLIRFCSLRPDCKTVRDGAPWSSLNSVGSLLYQHQMVFLTVHLILLVPLCWIPPLAAGQESDPPNIVLIVVDDLGWADVGFHGSVIRTPILDDLVTQSLLLTDFQTAPFCTPTRAGLLTGRHPASLGLARSVIHYWDDAGIDTTVATLPEVLSNAGYGERRIIGKWHLGHTTFDHHPLNNGFTHFYGTLHGSIGYFSKDIAGAVSWDRDCNPATEQGYVTDLLTEEAISFLQMQAVRRRRKQSSPFFLYLAYTSPHRPLDVADEWASLYDGLLVDGERLYAGMITNLDWNIGRVLDAIHDLGMSKDTVIMFLSDNGGESEFAGNNLPWRGGKATPYEGGTRVVAFVHAPGRISAGRWPEMGSYLDVMPTLLGAAGSGIPNGVEGRNLWQAWTQGDDVDPVDLTLLIGSELSEWTSLRRRNWKLVRRGYPVHLNPAEYSVLELFDLDQDPYESRNLIAENPLLADSLLNALAAWRSQNPSNLLLPSSVPPPAFLPPVDQVWRVAGCKSVGAESSVLVLGNSFPNPLNQRAAVPFTLLEPAIVRYEVYDVLGRIVKSAALGIIPAGTHQIQIDASDLASGLYMYRISAGGLTKSGGLVVAR